MTSQGARTLEGKTIIMSGGSRGIGLAIALRAARDGANVALLAKTSEPDPRLNGTVFSAAEAIEAAGGHALPIVGDVRSDESIAAAVSATVDRFGGIDICVNNASALAPLGTVELTAKAYDLMQDINTRGTFMLSRACLPHLLQASNPHVLTLSPPITFAEHWLARFPGYMLSKYGMSFATLGLAAEFRDRGLSANGLWPRTTIATDAVANLLGGTEALGHARKPEIVADAAHAILTTERQEITGQLLIDDDVLAREGVTDFAAYSVSGTGDDLESDFFLD
ncbi:MAG: NAD(P)-dependent oxidoreductase [Microbacteriaceae bacterium]|nr:NAD(P)-dependent oxidoreductase [Microbacteriaceae bacterium]